MTTAAVLQKTPRRRWLRWLKRIALGIVGLIALVIVAGTVYEWLATRAEAKRFPQQGRSVDVGGFRLNIDCTGTTTPGAPTVILESGAGVPAFGWNLVQPGVTKFARVCSYDRAAYGWSDPPLDMKRTSLQSAKELHTLLQNASVSPPYVLVGHSLGGYNIRVYNHLFPEEVAGAVFVDSSHPDQNERMAPSMKQFMNQQVKTMAWMKTLAPVLLNTGALRLLQHLQGGQDQLPPEFVAEMAYLQRNKDFLLVGFAELDSFNESATETRNSGNFGDKPVIVLTAGKFIDLPSVPKKDFAQFQDTWIHELQPQLATLSTRGKQVIVSNSTHMIPMDQPQTVVDAIREVVQETARTP